MKRNDNILFNNEGCITSGALLKYIKGELSGLERNRIEKHLSSCEMCSDEWEGLTKLEDIDQIDRIVNELNSKIDEIVEGKEEKTPVWGLYFRVAASIIVLLGISTVIYITAIKNTPSNTVSNNFELDIAAPKPLMEMADEAKKEPAVIAQGEVSRKSESQKSFEVKSKEGAAAIAAPVVVDSVMVIAVNDEFMDEEKVEITDTFSISAKNAVSNAQFAAQAYAPAKAEMGEKRKLLSNREVTGLDVASGAVAPQKPTIFSNYLSKKEEGLSRYNGKQYRAALQIFRKLITDYPNNDTIQYYTAMCYFNQNRYEDAKKVFEKLIINSHSPFYNEGKWNYARSLIKTNDLIKADSILYSIIKEYSPFSNDAKQKLDLIQKSDRK